MAPADTAAFSAPDATPEDARFVHPDDARAQEQFELEGVASSGRGACAAAARQAANVLVATDAALKAAPEVCIFMSRTKASSRRKLSAAKAVWYALCTHDTQGVAAAVPHCGDAAQTCSVYGVRLRSYVCRKEACNATAPHGCRARHH